MTKLVVLGATGMLGSAVFSLAQKRGLNVSGTTTDLNHVPASFTGAVTVFQGSDEELERVVGGLSEDDFVVNCVGLIKHHIDETSLSSRASAISLNAMLPHRLAALARAQGFRVIQIATDCVYSGERGTYLETDAHDGSDVYGQTKSLGEVPSPQVAHLRASIIGRELRTHRSLIVWALNQPADAQISGYLNHLWNGVSTVAFARIALGLVASDQWHAGISHLIPADVLSKYDLLTIAVEKFGRSDIHVEPTDAVEGIDRSLGTISSGVNSALWSAGGYASPPTIAEMIQELADVQGQIR